MDNKQIAGIFSEMSDILEIQGADFFRVNAYRKAALNILNMPQDLRDMVDKNSPDLKKLPGIGEGLRKKIIELITTGKCEEYDDIKKGFPEGLLEMLRLRGLGPKKVKLLYSELRIKNLQELKKAAEAHVIRDLPGMGIKSEADILKSIDEYAHFSSDRFLVDEALQEAMRIIKYMKICKDVKKIEYAGSLRRAQDTIGDIDILVTVKKPGESHKLVMNHFVKYSEVINVVAEGDTKSSVTLSCGIDVDLRVVDDKSFGAAMHYFTGNKAHNIHIRDLAKKKGLKVSEYGVFRGEKMVGGKDEKDIFEAVGIPYIIPEIRSDNGEIEYGLAHKSFPKFVELTDVKGDLHSHSTYSDGDNSIEEMAEACIKRGYEYFAISDHSSVMGVTGGMGKKDIKTQWEEIDKLNKKFNGKFTILKGCEVDILKDGSLDFSDDVLKSLDAVIISAHMYQRLSPDEQTKRLICAIENKYSRILGHPTGRMINRRAPMEFDMKKVIDACVKNDVIIEINSNPLRLDLIDKYIRIAKEKGAKFAINTDSHDTDQLNFMKYGVGIGRRGWLTKEDVVNTMSLKNLTLRLKPVYLNS
jgi:DNA polymerase (family 10)